MSNEKKSLQAFESDHKTIMAKRGEMMIKLGREVDVAEALHEILLEWKSCLQPA